MKGRLAFLDRWYEKTKALARHRYAERWLAFVAFIESSVFPIPVDIMIIPMVQAAPQRWWRIALIGTVFSVLGGIAGYAIGMFFFDTLAQPILEKLGKAEKMAVFSNKIAENGALWVFGAGLTPFPYKVITIMSGALKINFGVFVAASVVARTMRYFIVTGIVRLFGARAEYLLKEHFAKFSIGVFALVAAGYAAWRYYGGH